jgi:phosphate transport system substrate-binding protein
MRRRLAVVTGIVVALLLVLPIAPAEAGSSPSITGAGSTWAEIALEQWRADVAQQGLDVNYQPVGSTAGRSFYIIGQVDFAASEIPFLPDEIQKLKGENKSYQYIPDVAGGTALMYNLQTPSGQRITNLRLDAATAAGIFTGKIKHWNDPSIVRLNPGVLLPSIPIIPVLRSDGSGTSAKLADYFRVMAPSVWNPFAQQHDLPPPVQFWYAFPGSVAQKGSDGVANFVASSSGNGSIGYVESGFALARNYPVVALHNQSGGYALPTAQNVALALTHATLNRDLTQNLVGVYRAPEANAYPLASYSYLITETGGFDPAKGAVLGQFILYIACAGQQEAAPLGYSPLPKNLVGAVFDAVRRIPGAPSPPSLDSCANPTLTGQFNIGSGTPLPSNFTVHATTQTGGSTGGTSGGTSGGSSGGTSGGTSSGGNGGGKITGPGGPQLTDPSGQPIDPSTIAVLTAAERQARYDAAIAQANAIPSNARTPVVIAVLALLALLAVPFLLHRRRDPNRARKRWKHRKPRKSRMPAAPGEVA